MEPEELSPPQWQKLLESNVYSMTQLKALSHQLGVDPESLHHATKPELAIDLVQYLHRRGRIPDLAAAHAQRTTRHSDSLTGYRQRVLAETQYLDLKGIPLPQRRDGRTDTPHIPLDKIYIQLQAVAQKEQRQQEQAEEEVLAHQMRQEQVPSLVDVMAGIRTLGEYFYRQGKVYEAAERPQPVDPQAALKEHKRLVILGAPGAGKSTLLRYLARRAAENGQGSVPILISLREFATAYTTNPALTLAEYALQKQAAGSTHLREALQMAYEQGNIFWLLDGLDEARTLADDKIGSQVYQLQGQWVLTSRPVGYTGAGLPSVPTYEVLPLTPEKVDQFLEDWLALLAEEESQPEQLAGRVAALKGQLAERPQLQALTRNPLLLTFMAVLASRPHTQTLPHKRADLYALYLEQLRDWEIARLKAANPQSDFSLGNLKGDDAKKVVLEGLYYLGWALFLNYYGGRAEQVPSPDYLQGQVAAYLAQDGFGEAEAVAKGVWEFWRTAGMLDTWELEGHTYLAFRHFTFLEYATAWGLRRAWEYNERETWQFLKPRLHHPAWREPILLWGGGLPPAAITKVLRRLYWGVSSDERILHRDLLLAAALLAENPEVEQKVGKKIVRRLVWLAQSHNILIIFVLLLTWGVIPLSLFMLTLGLWVGLLTNFSILGMFIITIILNERVQDFFASKIDFFMWPLQLRGLASTPFLFDFRTWDPSRDPDLMVALSFVEDRGEYGGDLSNLSIEQINKPTVPRPTRRIP